MFHFSITPIFTFLFSVRLILKLSKCFVNLSKKQILLFDLNKHLSECNNLLSELYSKIYQCVRVYAKIVYQAIKDYLKL